MFEFNVNRMKKNVTEGVRRNLEERERRSNIMGEVERLRRSRELARLNQSLKSNDLLLMMAMRENDGSVQSKDVTVHTSRRNKTPMGFYFL